MFNISNNGIISITRGDSASAPLFLNQGTEYNPVRYRIKDLDAIYLAVMEPNQCFEHAILKQVYTRDNLNEEGDVVIRFRPEDTENLIPGKYYYQIKAKFNRDDGQDDVNTVVQKTEFWIEE